MSRLKEKTAIVTGAANGIGLAIAELFAEHGAWVLIVDLDEAAGSESAAAPTGTGVLPARLRFFCHETLAALSNKCVFLTRNCELFS